MHFDRLKHLNVIVCIAIGRNSYKYDYSAMRVTLIFIWALFRVNKLSGDSVPLKS